MALVLLSLSAGVVDAQLPEAGTTQGLGLCISFEPGWPSGQCLDYMQNAGDKFIRTWASWDFIERTKNSYTFATFDNLMADLQSRGIGMELSLCNGNSLYGTNPSDPAFQTGFKNYCVAMVNHYKGTGTIFELWNEPNAGTSGVLPHLTPSQYMGLMNIAVPAMRAADPNVAIIGPATCPTSTGIDTSFLTSCFNYGQSHSGQKGLLDLVDAVSVHAYEPPILHTSLPAKPEAVVSQYATLKSAIVQYHPSGAVPIVNSEWGYSTVQYGITAQVQGDYLARGFLIDMSQGIRQSNWYQFWNEGTDPNSIQDNYGLMAQDGVGGWTPKPAYNELQLLTRSLAGESFTSKLNDGYSSDWLLVFTGGGHTTLAAWTTGNPSVVDRNVPGWGMVNLTLTGTPQYVNLVPEPGTFVLLSAGLIGLLSYAWTARGRRRRT
jgi:hypothetical protein